MRTSALALPFALAFGVFVVQTAPLNAQEPQKLNSGLQTAVLVPVGKYSDSYVLGGNLTYFVEKFWGQNAVRGRIGVSYHRPSAPEFGMSAGSNSFLTGINIDWLHSFGSSGMGFYTSAGLGFVRYKSTIQLYVDNNYFASDEVSGNELTFDLALGYRISRHFSIEAGHAFSLKNDADWPRVIGLALGYRF
ncbi:MAG: hypothetical protein LBC63_03510 [Holophagales bacterium]|nr:hypothetical protein [Holophagales bacterium]